MLLTNNSIYTQRDLAARLRASGLDVPETAIWTSALATARFLSDQRPGGSAYVVGEAGVTTALHEAGYTLTERGEPIAFSFDDVLRYHGGHSPGGAAIAYKVLERALPELGPCERREISIETAFGGPGARDAFELVTRAVTGDRFVVDQGLARPELGFASERFVFELTYRDRTATLVVREGIVHDEFIRLARTEGKTDEQKARFAQLKLEMVERLMPMPADEVYDVDEGA
jgi:hypothetical protein